MRNIQKIKFSDIIGMLENDEMREITGGYGETYACGSYSPSGGGSSYNPGSILAGFGGGTAIGSTFGGVPYNPSSSSSSNNGISIGGSSNYGSSSYTAGWTYSNGKMTTNDPTVINRWYDVFMHVYGTTDTKSDPYAISRQINTFVNNESTIAGQQENIRLYGTVLNGLPPLMNNYKGPSTIAPGLMFDNGVLQYDNSFYNGGSGISAGSTSYRITPSSEFLASPFGAVYNKLTSENTNFLCLVDKFNSARSFNLNYIYSSVGMTRPTWDGQTTSSVIVQGKTIIGANVTQQFDPNKIFSVNVTGNVTRTYERSEIGKVTDIIHEALHAYLDINRISSGTDHTAFNQYRTLLIDTLTEYNVDNNLGFTATQINELAFKGTYGSSNVAPSEQFSCYIQGIAEKNGTTYTEEFKAFEKRIGDLNWNLISTKTN
jgi:hypothetical protein